jgi:small subunit ribosomal protein S4
MARYTGPRTKKSRRYGAAIFGSHKALERRNYPPGVHGSKGRKKQSDYAVALAEKQKLRYQYGILERQFRRYFEIASRKRGVTGDILLQLLETRLDNVVYRLGLANSRRAARQFVLHRHISVNGKVVAIPSYPVKVGDIVEVRDRPRSRAYAARSLEAMQLAPVPDWLVIDKEQYRAEVKRIPTREEIAPIANEQLVVELYSR